MTYLKLTDCSTTIENGKFKDLHLSKISALKAHLTYLDRLEIPAIIKLTSEVNGNLLKTSVEIECDDLKFKQVLGLVSHFII